MSSLINNLITSYAKTNLALQVMYGCGITLVTVATLVSLALFGGQQAHATTTQAQSTGLQRSWNSNTELLSNGTNRSEFHVKQINFKDADGQWKPIDVTPVPASDGWDITQAPFSAHFPLRSSGTATMVNNNRWDTFSDVPINEQDLTMTIRAENVVDVEGVLEYGDLGNGNEWYVRYPQAYPAQNADLVFLVWHGKVPRLQKLVRFNSALSADTDFTFLYSYPTKDPEFKKDGEKWNKGPKLHSNKGLAVGNDGARHGFGFKDFLIWDSGTGLAKHASPINVDIEKTTGHSYRLTKHIASSFFSGATLPVYTDTTNTFYPDPDTETNSVDGEAGRGAASEDFSTIRSGAGDQSVDNNASVQIFTRLTASGTSGEYSWNSRSMFLFYTGPTIDAGATIDSATFSLWGDTAGLDNFGGFAGALVQSSPASNTAIVNSDYNLGNWPPFVRQADTDVTAASWNSAGYNTWTLSATGTANIGKGGTNFTKEGLVNSYDFSGSGPGGANKDAYLVGKMSEAAGTDNDPKLVVDWYIPNSAPIAPTSLLTEGQTNPSSLMDSTPEFSAIYNDPDSGDTASWYEIQVSTSSTNWASPTWDSGQASMATTTQGSRSPDISYGATPLALDGTTYYWRIKFWDQAGAEGAYSSAAGFTAVPPISFDNATTCNDAGVQVTQVTCTHTVTSTGYSRAVFVGIRTSSPNVVSSITFGGSPMTVVATSTEATSNSGVYLYYLLSPATGSQDLVITFSSAVYADLTVASYTGVAQVAPEVKGSSSGGPLSSYSQSLTTTTAGDWTIMIEANNGSIGTLRPGTGTRRGSNFPTDAGMLLDSNGPVLPAGSTSLRCTWLATWRIGAA